ncbi:PspC domain-containing protein [Hansschlegelia sp.]|uniref:PspC domain-containing protein n=1 Tax=Hansschlegelia sp. TaxID=2041892 RepID=UPI002BE217C9|nr:PspC domain-containing protein [Hansschlegelia sp.]HVI27936.1 PspC domain-containing protein [Hansschlegelia sp.]
MIRRARALIPKRLGGWLLGVCATLSEITGLNPLIFRGAFLIGLVFSASTTLLAYAALYVVGRLLFAFTRDDEALMVEPPFPSGGAPQAALMGDELAMLERKLARLEAEALSADAITRARFRSAGL